MTQEKVENQAPPPAESKPTVWPVPVEPTSEAHGRAGCFWMVALLVLGVAGYGVYRWYPNLASGGREGGNSPSSQPGSTSSRTEWGGRSSTSRPALRMPVSTAIAKQGDLPIYFNGLGTVTALNTVTIHPRVDGQLMKVAFTEGQVVKEGDFLAEIDPRPFQVQLAQAEGQLARDQALLQNAKRDFERYKEAIEAVSKQQYDTAATLVAQYEGAVKTDQGQVDNAKLQLVYCHITAPLSGRIGLRLVDEGNMVHASDPGGLVVITQVQPIAVIFSLPQDQLPQVLKAQKADPELPVEAYNRDFKVHLATGKLLAIDNQIDPTTGMSRFKAVFENRDMVLYPNQFVNCRLLVETRKASVLVPVAALQRSPHSYFVYVVRDNDTVEMRPVTMGPTEGDEAIVEQGLTPGELVVTDGADKLQDGAPVIVRRSYGAASQPTTRTSR